MARRVEVHLVGDSRSLERAYARAERSGRQFEASTKARFKTYAKAGAIGADAAGRPNVSKGVRIAVDGWVDTGPKRVQP